VLEALCTGTPVVGSDRAGIRELINTWGGGVLFEAGNASQLAHLLVECDFQSMKRDPTPIQASWREQFSRSLNALVHQMQPG
jgi:glycosyltransferase involved in cell wall biosynthesis